MSASGVCAPARMTNKFWLKPDFSTVQVCHLLFPCFSHADYIQMPRWFVIPAKGNVNIVPFKATSASR